MPNSLNSLNISFFVLCLLICCAATLLSGQEPLSDMEILLQKHDQQQSVEKPAVTFLQSRSDRAVVRYNPLNLSFGGLMFVYQRFLSPQLAAECLYHTSCSAFSKELIYEYGLIKGVVATADRLLRCNRVAVFDIHPMNMHPISGKAVETPAIYGSDKP